MRGRPRLYFIQLLLSNHVHDANISPSEEFRDRLFQGYDDDWDSDFDEQPDDRSQMPPPAQPGAGGGGGMLSLPKNSNQSGSSGDVR